MQFKDQLTFSYTTKFTTDVKPSKNEQVNFLSRFTPITNDPEHPQILLHHHHSPRQLLLHSSPEIQERVKIFQLHIINALFPLLTKKSLFIIIFSQESVDGFYYLQRATKLIVVIKSSLLALFRVNVSWNWVYTSADVKMFLQ